MYVRLAVSSQQKELAESLIEESFETCRLIVTVMEIERGQSELKAPLGLFDAVAVSVGTFVGGGDLIVTGIGVGSAILALVL